MSKDIKNITVGESIAVLTALAEDLHYLVKLDEAMSQVRLVSNCTVQQITDLTERIGVLGQKYPTPTREFVFDCLSKLRDLGAQGATWDELVGWVDSMEDEA